MVQLRGVCLLDAANAGSRADLAGKIRPGGFWRKNSLIKKKNKDKPLVVLLQRSLLLSAAH